MSFKLGMNCKLYRNSGTHAVPVLDEIPNCKNLSLALSTTEADVTTRSNNGWEAVVAALKRGGITFQMVYDTADTDFTALLTMFLGNTVQEFFVLDGVSTVPGTQGLRATCMITDFSQDQNLTEAVMTNVSMKPTYSANAPSWYTVA